MTLDKNNDDEPKLIDCEDCGGEGSWDTGTGIYDYTYCDTCEGKGKVYDM
jgi:DnaJ-class molecular chaperone